jgi:preprotein translocase SecE subunit
VNNLTSYIWLAFAAAVFALLWYKGYLLRLRHYVRGTREELRKCNWPNREELRESTITVMISIALLGVFTAVVDLVLGGVFGFLNS